MHPGVYRQFADIEDRHWWFVARRRLVDTLLAGLGGTIPDGGLDVGCGTGGNLDLLKKHCRTVVGLDASPEALALAARKYPSFPLVRGNANELERLFRPGSFGLAGFFNVFYHRWIGDEADVLRQVRRVLKPGGCVVLSEPAFDILTRRHDGQVMGRRRYRLGFFKDLLRRNDFEILRSTYFNSVCLLPALCRAGWDAVHRPRSFTDEDPVHEMDVPPPLVNRAMLTLMDAERGLLRRFGSVPAGVTLLCIARKKD